jgi:hypothetical protein
MLGEVTTLATAIVLMPAVILAFPRRRERAADEEQARAKRAVE